MDIFVDLDKVNFIPKLVNEQFSVKVPEFLDVHKWWPNWERARFESMKEKLFPGMVFLDVGAFDGWQDAIIARFVGGECMVLVEPVAENWANIKATWEANELHAPLATFKGFIADYETNEWHVRYGWPQEVDYSKLIAVTKFKLIIEHREETEAMKLDTLVDMLPMLPSAVNIDVEGAAIHVLTGGRKFFSRHNPLIWLSIHPELKRDRYNTQPELVHNFLKELGYEGQFLDKDHEEHWFYER